MTLQQLRYLCRMVECGFNVSEAARTLHTSQPGVSRYLLLLEEELGLQLFIRKRKRIVALTPAAQAIVGVAKRMVADADNLEFIAREYRAGDAGELTVATFHTHARYTLPPVIERFTKRYPRVQLRLRQGYLSQVAQWVKNGDADLLVATVPSEPMPELVFLPCHELHRVILTPPNHPLLSVRRVTLRHVAEYPIITYDYETAAQSQIMRAFHKNHLTPNVVVRATDADIMKTYAQRGVGVAIVAHTAFDSGEDRELRAIDARHLFESSTVHVGLRRDAYLSAHMIHFIELFAPRLRRSDIESAVNPRAVPLKRSVA